MCSFTFAGAEVGREQLEALGLLETAHPDDAIEMVGYPQGCVTVAGFVVAGESMMGRDG